MASVDLSNVVDIKNGVFRVILYVAFGGVGAWIVAVSFVLLRIQERFGESSCIAGYMNMIVEVILPLAGSMLFLPLNSLFLDVFIGYEATSDDITDAFLVKDGFEYCFRRDHIAYLIACGLALAIYTPSAIFMMPKWQEFQDDLQILVRPRWLLIKGGFICSIIAISKSVRHLHETTHAFLFLAILVTYTFIFVRTKPYNYARINLWCNGLLAGAIWVSMIGTINLFVQATLVLMILLGSGCLVIALGVLLL